MGRSPVPGPKGAATAATASRHTTAARIMPAEAADSAGSSLGSVSACYLWGARWRCQEPSGKQTRAEAATSSGAGAARLVSQEFSSVAVPPRRSPCAAARMLVPLLQLLQPATTLILAATQLSNTWFSLHPPLMAVGFTGFLGQGVLTSLAVRGVEGDKRAALLTQHALWCVLGG